MTVSCPRCQYETQHDDHFCGACGYDLSQDTAAIAGTQLDIKVADVQFSLAMVYFKNKKFEDCVRLLQRVIEQDPENGEAHSLLEQASQNLDSESVEADNGIIRKE